MTWESCVRTIDQWKTDQAKVLAASLALLDLVDRPTPVPRAELTAARWRVASALLRYLPIVDRIVYARLRLHSNPAAAAMADRFEADAATIYALFERHSTRWTPEAVEADWSAYRAAVRHQAAIVRRRFERELAELLPYLETASSLPPVRQPGHRNWAGDGWKFRDILGVDSIAAPASAG